VSSATWTPDLIEFYVFAKSVDVMEVVRNWRHIYNLSYQKDCTITSSVCFYMKFLFNSTLQYTSESRLRQQH